MRYPFRTTPVHPMNVINLQDFKQKMVKSSNQLHVCSSFCWLINKPGLSCGSWLRDEELQQIIKISAWPSAPSTWSKAFWVDEGVEKKVGDDVTFFVLLTGQCYIQSNYLGLRPPNNYIPPDSFHTPIVVNKLLWRSLDTKKQILYIVRNTAPLSPPKKMRGNLTWNVTYSTPTKNPKKPKVQVDVSHGCGTWTRPLPQGKQGSKKRLPQRLQSPRTFSHNWLVRWSWGLLRRSWWLNWTNPIWKNMRVRQIGSLFSTNRGENSKKCLSCHHQEELIMAGYAGFIESPYLSFNIPIYHLGVTQHCTILECLSSKTTTQITRIHESRFCNKNSITRERKIKLKLNTKFNQSPPPPQHQHNTNPGVFSLYANTVVKEQCIHP